MNQILVTGEEYNKKQQKKQKQPKMQKQPKQNRTLIEINPIVIFYAISIMLLGICLITGSVYAKDRINETVEANAKPVLDITKDDINNTLSVKVTHIRGIKNITYKWNDGETTEINGNNQKTTQGTIPLIGGENVLEINITEENGQTVTYRNTYVISNIPEINLEAVSNGIKVIITSEEEIEYMTYQWDNREEEKVEIGKEKYEGTITAPKGQHTLKITAVDVNGNKGTKTQAVVGDEAPTLTLKADRIDGKLVFVIDAEDDEEISEVEITLNGGTPETIDVNDTKFHKEVEMLDGENRLKVVVRNKNNLETVKGGKFTK